MDSIILRAFRTSSDVEVVINLKTGASYFTQSGYSRASGKDRSVIVRRCQGCAEGELLIAEVLTEGGIQGCVLIPAKLGFKWALKDNIELAERMGEAGSTVYIHLEAGYKFTSTATEPTNPIPKILTPEFKAAEQHITYATEQYKFWTEQGNIRMQAMWETRIFQCSDVYLALVSENQPTVNGQPTANTGNVKYEGAVDVVIRLKLPFRDKFESALGRYCSERLQDFKVMVDEEQLNDYRTSQASNKRIPATMYKAFCPEVEQVVTQFCEMMQSRQWMTMSEYKSWARQQKAVSN